VSPSTALLLERALTLDREWWYTPAGKLISADAAGHTGIVFDRLIGDYCKLLGVSNKYDSDRVMFRTDVFDGVFNHALGAAEVDDPWEALNARLLKAHSPEYVADVRKVLSPNDDLDAREFSIKHWNWIRLARNNAECHDLTRPTLKRVGAGFSKAIQQEHPQTTDADLADTLVWVSTYNGDGRGNGRSVTVQDLLDGRISTDAPVLNHQTLQAAGAAAVRALDAASTHPYYASRQESQQRLRLNSSSLVKQGEDARVLYYELKLGVGDINPPEFAGVGHWNKRVTNDRTPRRRAFTVTPRGNKWATQFFTEDFYNAGSLSAHFAYPLITDSAQQGVQAGLDYINDILPSTPKPVRQVAEAEPRAKAGQFAGVEYSGEAARQAVHTNSKYSLCHGATPVYVVIGRNRMAIVNALHASDGRAFGPQLQLFEKVGSGSHILGDKSEWIELRQSAGLLSALEQQARAYVRSNTKLITRSKAWSQVSNAEIDRMIDIALHESNSERRYRAGVVSPEQEAANMDLPENYCESCVFVCYSPDGAKGAVVLWDRNSASYSVRFRQRNDIPSDEEEDDYGYTRPHLARKFFWSDDWSFERALRARGYPQYRLSLEAAVKIARILVTGMSVQESAEWLRNNRARAGFFQYKTGEEAAALADTMGSTTSTDVVYAYADVKRGRGFFVQKMGGLYDFFMTAGSGKIEDGEWSLDAARNGPNNWDLTAAEVQLKMRAFEEDTI